MGPRGKIKGKGIRSIVDAVGGPLLTDLVQGAAFGAKVILYGGLSEQRFQLHNNDFYLNGVTIELGVTFPTFGRNSLAGTEDLNKLLNTQVDKALKR